MPTFSYADQSRFSKRITIAFRRYVFAKHPSRWYQSLFGALPEDIRKFTELQFESGMSWDNYGLWDFDHVVPLVMFDFTSADETALCFHFLNTRPLSAAANRHKGAGVSEARQEMILRLEAWPESNEILGLLDILDRSIPKTGNKYLSIAESWSPPEFSPKAKYRHSMNGTRLA